MLDSAPLPRRIKFMRLGITAKLFLGVLATSVLVALVMAVAGQLGFQRDFRRYIETAEARRTEILAETLGAVYAERGNWSSLAGMERRWRSLLRRHPRPAEGAEGRHAGGRAWPGIALYDVDGSLVAGRPGAGEDVHRHPVVVDGEVIGWIVRTRSRRPTEDADLRFQQAQLRNLAVATFAAVVFAALAAWLLSRTFLAPARTIGDATHRLAAGDFKARALVGTTDEFGRLADDFNLLARTLQRNEEVRRRMMADVAHELRTPLAIVQGELAAVEDGIRPFGPATLGSLQAEIRALGKLVDDLYQLSLSDLGALDYRRQDVELRVLVAEALAPLKERCAAAGVELDDTGVRGEALPVHADPGRLGQLVNNLVENALRYTDSPGRIEVSCRRVGPQALLEIHDTAPGVDETLLPRLFERFFRVEHSRARSSGGAGLGLAICRNIVEAHDGTIEAAASPLGGLCVAARLPLLKGAA
jgi:two-component system, OmpR family, sensor histidine kinase BaeS